MTTAISYFWLNSFKLCKMTSWTVHVQLFSLETHWQWQYMKKAPFFFFFFYASLTYSVHWRWHCILYWDCILGYVPANSSGRWLDVSYGLHNVSDALITGVMRHWCLQYGLRQGGQRSIGQIATVFSSYKFRLTNSGWPSLTAHFVCLLSPYLKHWFT